MTKRGFTLIELLVVIAIIAILAAILFPVFAQAKAAAKKAADISNLKQTSIATAIYTNDNDDLFPLAARFIPDAAGGGTWGWNFSVSTPIGWMGPTFAQGMPARMAQDSSHWSNTIQPYAKNYGLYEGPGLQQMDIYGYPHSGNPGQLAAPANVNLTYNGQLMSWPTTGLANSSKAIVFWEGRGNANTFGNSLSSPTLYCDQPIEVAAGPCIFTPNSNTQGGSATSGGALFTPASPGNSNVYSQYASNWCYTKNMNFTFADTSAKTRILGAVTNGQAVNTTPDPRTDGNTDPETGYNNVGVAGFYYTSTADAHGYAFLFRPNYGG